MNKNDIDALIAIRERLTNHRDEMIDFVTIEMVDERLHQVPPGARNDVDLLLGRNRKQARKVSKEQTK